MVYAAENPFRTQKMHGLIYSSPELHWETFFDRLGALNYRGAIVGPHGHGKTTLLTELLRRLAARGFHTIQFVLNDRERNIDTARLLDALSDTTRRTIVVVDGAEQLRWLKWADLVRHCKSAHGLIITCHSSGRLPTLYECKTSPALLDSLLDHLVPSKADALRSQAHRLFSKYDGNLREVWFALYDYCADYPVNPEN